MTDFMTKQQRSRHMAGIRRVSKLERLAKPVAKAAAGCLLRSGKSGLPGKPDYFNKSRKTVVFVHGCFWHACPLHGTVPKTNSAFWANKLWTNAVRDRRVIGEYERMGWRSVVLWEHDLKRM
jgi:DNA mismatch endonuclease (patch repair protein)